MFLLGQLISKVQWLLKKEVSVHAYHIVIISCELLWQV